MLYGILFLLINAAFFALEVGVAGFFPKPLSQNEEKEALEQMKNGDASARDKLIEHNLRLVAHIVKKYHSDAKDQDDLISIGTIGLIKAIGTFKTDKGINLSTYAARCIENEILMYFRGQKKTSAEVYIDDPIDTDKDGNTIRLLDVICSEEDTFENISRMMENEKLRRCVSQELSARERRIIVMRYGLDNRHPRTQREVAKLLGISRSYVSRIEKRALLKLRALLESEAVSRQA
ncbi:MAG: RNA polymerase sporulation sigma factor SigK [Clostridia bacterium]|nr:RNA polymerase sporulation sigma factor SigK [Clostridia bacterium]